ncbi:MAG: nucleotidyltransferase domain-containing protein [bacterium]
MKKLEQLNLRENEKKALRELKERLLEKFPDIEIILFGSKARGDYEEESDIDLLILIDLKVNRKLKEEITEISYDIELKYDVVFGKIVENKDFWDSALAKAMPLHWNIDKEGIHV